MNLVPPRIALAISLAGVAFFNTTTARADPWEEAIRRVEASAREYHDYAVEVGGTGWAGTMYNGYHSDRHQCAILGRILGQEEAIAHLEELKYPPLGPESDPHELLVFSISLENWVGAARWVLGAQEHVRINHWNLDCVGRQGIPNHVAMRSPQPNAEFEVAHEKLYVYGNIDEGFADRFERALLDAPGITIVALGSGGGSVVDAVRAGARIRDRGLSTEIYGNCLSACPLVFIGGVERRLWAAPHRLGFHQIYDEMGGSVPPDDAIYDLVARYATLVGSDPNVLISWMLSAGPSEMFEPEVESLCAAGIATWVQRVCSGEELFR